MKEAVSYEEDHIIGLMFRINALSAIFTSSPVRPDLILILLACPISRVIEKTSAADGKAGYAYMLTWLDAKDTQLARITITDENGYQISRDGYYYKVGADLSIDIELLDEMLNYTYRL